MSSLAAATGASIAHSENQVATGSATSASMATSNPQ